MNLIHAMDCLAGTSTLSSAQARLPAAVATQVGRVARNLAVAAVLVFGGLLGTSQSVSAQSAIDDCTDGRLLEQSFDSGASWSVCARIDDIHGLELRNLSYRAPGDSSRPVLRSLHMAQLLVHWHDETQPEPRLGGSTAQTRGLGGSASLPFDAANCEGEALAISAQDNSPALLCSRVRDNGLLVRFERLSLVQGRRWELFSASQQGLLVWRNGVTLTEDGQIVPSVALSGRAERSGSDPRFGNAVEEASAAALLTRATLLATWRLHFNLDTPGTDRVEEIDFPFIGTLAENRDYRRPMQVRGFDVEVFRKVAPSRFRGWRVIDPTTGAGYTLDPIDSGRAWNAPGGDWTRFEFAATQARECERLAEENAVSFAALQASDANGSPASCGGNLDSFVNGESLTDADPVLWYSLTRLWSPRAEDLPFLSSVAVEMRIAPFDWTASSPFGARR